MSALIEFQGFNKFFGEAQVLKGIDLRVQSGEVVVILGPSGCGKSTLLRCLNGLEVAHSGSLRFAGNELLDKKTDWRHVRQDIGMVFQSYHLFPHMSVLDNLLLGPLKVQKRDPRTGRETVGTRGLGRQARRLPAPALRWPTATHRYRPLVVHEPSGHAV